MPILTFFKFKHGKAESSLNYPKHPATHTEAIKLKFSAKPSTKITQPSFNNSNYGTSATQNHKDPKPRSSVLKALIQIYD